MSSRARRVKRAFDREALRRVCEMHEDDFAEAYDLGTFEVQQRYPADRYYFRDNGADVLFVAHLDTVVQHSQRTTRFVTTEAGEVVHSGALDDRLGAYIGLELLPELGITLDWLLTTGEESGMSTADDFDPPKDYNWVIEFDRGGTDVVMYQYEDAEIINLVRDSGARVGDGILSDISYMEHLECKCFNWGVGYQDYHSTRGYAYLSDTFQMVGYFLRFYAENHDNYLPHDYVGRWAKWGGGSSSWWDDDPDWIGRPAKKADVVDAMVVEDYDDEAVLITSTGQAIIETIDPYDEDGGFSHAEEHGGWLAPIGDCLICDAHREAWERAINENNAPAYRPGD